MENGYQYSKTPEPAVTEFDILIRIIIIQHLYGALKSDDAEVLVASG